MDFPAASAGSDSWCATSASIQVEKGRYGRIQLAQADGTNIIIAVKVFDRPFLASEKAKRQVAIKREVELVGAAQGGVSPAIANSGMTAANPIFSHIL